MRRHSLMDRIGLFGRAGIDIVAVLGRSTIFLFHALLGRGGIGRLAPQLIKSPLFAGAVAATSEGTLK